MFMKLDEIPTQIFQEHNLQRVQKVQKPVELRQELQFSVAYWKKQWVAVPFFYLPPGTEIEDSHLARFVQRKNKASERVPVLESIVPWLWAEKVLKQLCRRNGLPLAWVTDRFPRKKYATKGSANRREGRKLRPLTFQEFKGVRNELAKLNEQAALIARILWYLNRTLRKGGGFVTLEELVRLQIQDVSPKSDDGSNWIRLQRTGMNNTQLVVLCLPPQLWKALCRQINDNSMFVFSTKNGGPLLSEQVDSHLRKAGKLAELKGVVTSVSLRPPFDKRQLQRSTKKWHCDAAIKRHLESVTPDEWLDICKRIPAIVERKGRKAAHEPRDLFNAMLHIEKTQCSLRKLPSNFPPWGAVESQRRRWKKSGIFEAVMALRKQKSEIQFDDNF